MQPHGIMFHHFHGDQHPVGQGSLSADQLATMIDFLGRDRILPAAEWRRRALSGALGEGDLCLTFDDNLRCQYDIACPVLEDYGITAFWFVYTSVLEGKLERLELYRHFRTVYFESVGAFYDAFYRAANGAGYEVEISSELRTFEASRYLVAYPFYTVADKQFRYVRDDVLGTGRYHKVMDGMMAAKGVDIELLARNLWMDEVMLRQLHDEGHLIGLHSHTHPTRMAELPYEEQEREYRANQACLARWLGTSPDTMSHPCNSYNDDTLRALRSLGVKLGFRSNTAQKASSSLEYPREDHTNVLAEMSV